MTILVVGAGPAGLMAAEAAAQAGAQVIVADAKPSVGRKFLMAGKSGLNLTKDEPDASFGASFVPAEPLLPMIAEFGPAAVQDWTRGLGQDIFTGSSGRVFPVAMKASPLLRAWIARLTGLGVTFRLRHRWTGFDGQTALFATPGGPVRIKARATVLALGGASWSRLGSDGAWADILGAPTEPFRPANMGFTVNWSPHMDRHFGQPVKGIALRADGPAQRGEFIVSARGIEGGGIYAVAAAARDGAAMELDLLPDMDTGQIASRLRAQPKRETVANRLRKALKLDPVQIALLQEWGRPLPAEPAALAALIKALPVRHAGPRPLDEAISTAGGVAWPAVDRTLMLRDRPGVFVAGEMLDWEAPTGGYLITGCLATGRWAGRAAAGWAPA